MPRDAVTGCVPHAVTALPASLPIRPLLAAFLAAGTPQPHGAVAVAGGRVTCSSTGTVAVLLAVGPMETRGTTVLTQGPIASRGAAAGAGGGVAGGIVPAGTAQLAVSTKAPGWAL